MPNCKDSIEVIQTVKKGCEVFRSMSYGTTYCLAKFLDIRNTYGVEHSLFFLVALN